MSESRDSEMPARNPSPPNVAVEGQADVERSGLGPTLLIKWVAGILTGLFLLGAAASLLAYISAPVWQMLAMTIGGVAFAGISGTAIYLADRGDRERAAHIVLASVVLDFALVMLFVRGIDLYVVAGGALLILIIGQIVTPRRWVPRLIALGALAALALFVRLLEPVHRYDLGLDLTATVAPPLVFLALILAFAFVAIRSAQSARIRTRLLISFGLIALIPGLLIASASIIFSLRSSERRIFNELEATARVRESQLVTWIQDLQLDLLALRELESSAFRILLTSEPDSQAFRSTYTLQKNRLLDTLAVRGNFAAFLVVSRDGVVLLSTNPVDELENLRDTVYFQEGLAGLYVSPFELPASLSLDDAVVTFALPIRSGDEEVLGVLVGRASGQRIQDIMVDRTGLASSREVYLIDTDRRLLVEVTSEYSVGEVMSFSEGIDQALAGREAYRGRYLSYRGEPVLSVSRWLPSLDLALLVEAPRNEMIQTAMTMVGMNLVLTIVSVGLAVGMSVFISRDIALPLREVSEVATQIAEGDLNRTVPIARQDEIGALAAAFNRMSTRLRNMVGSLEERVAERTMDLERRSVQVETAARVAHQAASIRDVDQLLDVVAHQIAEQFGFYHVGIYLIDDARRWARMRASSSGGGERLLARGFRMGVGASGIIGDVAATGEPRIALDVAEDARYINVPELPETQSEMSLPLRVRDEVIGVLDVQSEETAFFSQDDVAYLQIMADQIGLAIENARLLDEAEQRLQEIGLLVLNQQREGWRRLASRRPHWAYIYDGLEVQPRGAATPQVGEPDLVLPLGGEAEGLGTVKVALGADRSLSREDLELVEAITDEAGRALERARFFSDTQDALLEAGVLYRGSRAIVGASTVDEVLHAFVEHLTTDAVDCCVLMMRDVRPALGIEQIRVAAIWNSMVDSSHLVGRRWAREAMPVLWQTTDSVRAIVDYREESGLDSESRQMLRDVFDLQSVLVIPLLTGEVLGWLLVGSISDRYSFTEREIRLYRGLADQAATVVQNFELLDLATDQAERERLVSVLGARIRSSTDVETILRTSIREVSRVLEASEAVISLHHPERNGHTSEEDGAQAADRDNGSGM